jgi:hypothetical protein
MHIAGEELNIEKYIVPPLTGTKKFHLAIFFSAGQKGLHSQVICLPEEA